MIFDFETARKRFIDIAPQMATETIQVDVALGRVLAQTVAASRQLPEFDTSAMDGYAIDSATGIDMPWSLPIVGEAAAGSAPSLLQHGTAMRIFTGAALPAGANAVVMQERVTRDADQITCNVAVNAYSNVRRCGEDMRFGADALKQGQRLFAPALSLLRFLGTEQVTTYRVPRVAILCTGSELRLPGQSLRPGAIYESNSLALRALIEQTEATVISTNIVADDLDKTVNFIESLLEQADVLVTVGGASVGDHDHIVNALKRADVEVDLHNVAIKPGKPILVGTKRDKVVIGLPGNPASAIVTFALFGMPLLRAMQVDEMPVAMAFQVETTSALRHDPKRTRAILGTLQVDRGRTRFSPFLNQSSGSTVALGQSTGLAILPVGDFETPVGASVSCVPWSSF